MEPPSHSPYGKDIDLFSFLIKHSITDEVVNTLNNARWFCYYNMTGKLCIFDTDSAKRAEKILRDDSSKRQYYEHFINNRDKVTSVSLKQWFLNWVDRWEFTEHKAVDRIFELRDQYIKELNEGNSSGQNPS